MAVNPKFIKPAYEISKAVYEKKISDNAGINKLVNKHHFNRGSAKIIISQVFPKLISGQSFTWNLSLPYFDYFLERILLDYNTVGIVPALESLVKNINYRKKKNVSTKGLQRIYNKYKTLNRIQQEEDQDEQDLLIKTIRKSKSRAEIIRELNNIKETDSEEEIIHGKRYKRDNKTIAQLKLIRGIACQICGDSILKADGSRYIEAAHINPKCKKGCEMPRNIILLCPNHHKEFDYGKRDVIIKHTNDIFHFSLNGKIHKITLTLI